VEDLYPVAYNGVDRPLCQCRQGQEPLRVRFVA